jgi:hypothetical protein
MAVHGFTRMGRWRFVAFRKSITDGDVLMLAGSSRTPMKPIDYSDRAISLRIERLGQLRTLCLELKKTARKAANEKRPGTAPGR